MGTDNDDDGYRYGIDSLWFVSAEISTWMRHRVHISIPQHYKRGAIHDTMYSFPQFMCGYLLFQKGQKQ